MAAVIATSLAPAPAEAQPPTKQVLIVHGGPEEFPGNPDFDTALRKVLFSHPTLQVAAYSEYLENEEFSEAAYTSLRDYIRVKFRDLRPDLIIANAAPALQFVLRYRDELFPGVPVLFAAATLPPAGAPGRSRGGHRHLARTFPGRNTGPRAEDPSSDEASSCHRLCAGGRWFPAARAVDAGGLLEACAGHLQQ